MPKSLFDKVWSAHEVAPGLIYIDLHLVHEVTSPQAFDGLRLAGRRARTPARALATGTSEVEHVLATQCMVQAKPRSMRVEYTGELRFGVTAKDLILGTI